MSSGLSVFAGPLPLAEIASRCGVSERTLTRRFTEAIGLTPLRYQQLLRLELFSGTIPAPTPGRGCASRR
jgi:methylphosphotriester-DNA--protein-cysteine methyltransferase